MKLKLTLLLLLGYTVSFAQAPDCPEPDVKILPVLWQQTAAEYKALCYQAFNLATLRVDQIPKQDLKSKKLAIITDLDETILDNSPSDAQLIKEGLSYTPQLWRRWTDKSAAAAVPGAVAFLQHAHELGIEVFYISNRDTGALASTLLNLKYLHLPNADKEHMLFLEGASSKEERRKKVMQDHEVIMLIGDNLGDFSALFDKKPVAERAAETERMKDEWGRKFIVLPNAVYGEWENALYDYNRKLSPAERREKRKNLLLGY